MTIVFKFTLRVYSYENACKSLFHSLLVQQSSTLRFPVTLIIKICRKMGSDLTYIFHSVNFPLTRTAINVLRLGTDRNNQLNLVNFLMIYVIFGFFISNQISLRMTFTGALKSLLSKISHKIFVQSRY